MLKKRSLFVYFRSFQATKTVDRSGIQTQIVKVEDEHADFLTTTTTNQRLTYVCEAT